MQAIITLFDNKGQTTARWDVFPKTLDGLHRLVSAIDENRRDCDVRLTIDLALPERVQP